MNPTKVDWANWGVTGNYDDNYGSDWWNSVDKDKTNRQTTEYNQYIQPTKQTWKKPKKFEKVTSFEMLQATTAPQHINQQVPLVLHYKKYL